MKNIKVSKIGLISLALVFLAAGAVFWILNNRDEASTVTPNNDLTPAIASDNLVPITSVPILMYHYIRNVDPNDTLGANLSVSPNNFSEQLDYLVANNYQTISLSQMRDGFSGNYKIDAGKKPIVITFDDGYDDAYTQALPILKKHNMIGVFYIITGQTGNAQRMTDDQIIELDRTGMTIGAHSVNHTNLTSSSRAEFEINRSKLDLERLLEHEISDFCYPAGDYDDIVETMVSTALFKTATTTKNGITDINSDLLALPRIRMQNSTNLARILSN